MKNRSRLVNISLILSINCAIFAFSSLAVAKDKECWVDLYQDSQYSGKHVRLQGPIELENLQNVEGENWESCIDSLVVGPKASVIVFENNNFKMTLKEMEKYPELLRSLGLTQKDAMEDKEVMFGANTKVHDLSDFNYRNKVRSIKISCNK